MKLILALLFSVSAFASNLPKDSIYQLEGEWRNQDAKVTPLSSFQGKPTVVAMVFTSCEFSCPMMIQKLKDIEADLLKAGADNFQIVIASFDWKRDLPKKLNAYMKKHKLPKSHWSFLSPKSDADVRELAVVLGVSYQPVEGGDFSHSNEINLLDANGVSIFKLKGVSSDHKEFVQKAVETGKAK